MLSGSIKNAAQSVNDRVQRMDSMLRSEVYGGNWNDEVGRSYLSYTESLRRMAEKFISVADNLKSIEASLEAANEYADKDKLEKIKAAVQSV